MTTQAMPVTRVAASIPSIPPCPALALADGDVSVTATFRPLDPLDATEVVTSLDIPDNAGLLNLLDTTITRLITYRDAYQQAMAENDQPVTEEDADPAPVRAPLPLPVPWYAW
jgi:hypothetical protein